MKIDESVAAARSARKPLEWSAEDLRGRGLTLEWLEADGLGGFASGRPCGLATRRYHGLLCVAKTPPTGRRMRLLSAPRRMSIEQP